MLNYGSAIDSDGGWGFCVLGFCSAYPRHIFGSIQSEELTGFNNLCELTAIDQILNFLIFHDSEVRNLQINIYSDSLNAIGWSKGIFYSNQNNPYEIRILISSKRNPNSTNKKLSYI